MIERPTGATIQGRRYLDLRRLAANSGRATDELLQLYTLEGFLDRLSHTEYTSRFVLKGGVLLAAFDARRPTRDIDFAAIATSSDVAVLQEIVGEVSAVQLDDGLVFDGTSTAELIREDDTYSGVRVNLRATLSSFVATFHVDVNVGDPIWPGPLPTLLPRLLGGEPISILGYPPAMVLAEKVVTAIQRGTANTRWRDFVDIAMLATDVPASDHDLLTAVARVASHRRVNLGPLSAVLDGYGPIAQQRWAAWRRKQNLAGATPADFSDLLAQILPWCDEVLTTTTGT